MTKFKVGDVVYLKSDLNQKMTVRKVDDDGITCVWFGADKGMFAHHFFPETLMLDTEFKKLKAKILDTTKHCKEVEESNRELRDKVRDLETCCRDLERSKDHWSSMYSTVEDKYREYRDWLMELGLLEKSPNKRFKTREEWKKIREQENGKD